MCIWWPGSLLLFESSLKDTRWEVPLQCLPGLCHSDEGNGIRFRKLPTSLFILGILVGFFFFFYYYCGQITKLCSLVFLVLDSGAAMLPAS